MPKTTISLSLLLTLAAAILFPGICYSTPECAFDVVSVTTQDDVPFKRVTVIIQVKDALDFDPSSLKASSSTQNAPQVLVLDNESPTSRLLLIEAQYDPDAPLFVLQLLWGVGPLGPEGCQLFFESVERTMRPIRYQDALRQLDRFEPATVGPAYPAKFENLPPEVNPLLPMVDREFARTQAQPAIQTSPYQMQASTTPKQGDVVSCGAAQAHGPVVLFILTGFLMAMRRRKISFSTLLILVAGPVLAHAGKASARTVYGYVVFWDSRTEAAGSDAPGSRIPWCNTSQGSCAAIDAGCCFRPLDTYTISVRNSGGPVLASAVANKSGFYLLNFSGDDSREYVFTVHFERPSGAGPGALILSDLAVPQTMSRMWKVTLPSATNYYWLPDLRLSHAFDTNSITGGIASAWQSVSDVQRGIEAEGESRHRRNFGAPTNGPDDTVVIDIGSGWTGSSCGWFSLIGVTPTNARGVHPGVYMGQVYRSRVVGCHTTPYSNGVATVYGPAFPPAPILQTDAVSFTGEGVALGLGLDYLTWILSRWSPDLATLPDPNIGSSYSCIINEIGNSHSNDAAYFKNNARALWEWIDSSTAQTFGVDNSDITLAQLMTGLKELQNTPGTADGQSGEAFFTPTTTQCTSNHSCSPGDACVLQSGLQKYCAGGDPHGSNVRDLAEAVDRLGVPARGNLLTSMSSSYPCMGGPDNGWRFDGGYTN